MHLTKKLYFLIKNFMKDIFNFFKNPDYETADIMLNKSETEKKILNKKLIFILLLLESILIILPFFNDVTLMSLKLISQIENT